MTRIFEANVQLFARENPRAAVFLSTINADGLKIITTVRGERNLCDVRSGKELFFHHIAGAKNESDAWAKNLNLEGISVIIVLGIGIGYAYQSLEAWLQQESSRSLIFLEYDLAVLSVFFETTFAKELLFDPQVHLYFLEDSEAGVEVLQAIAWATYSKKSTFAALPFYEQSQRALFAEIRSRFLYEAAEIHAVVDEYVVYGIPFLRNFWKNLFLLPGSRCAEGLKGQFRGIPAIVVAAGPSLGTQLALLRELKNHALILSGGSAVNALAHASIIPHFIAGIDPNPTQYLRVREQSVFQVPFFFRTRIFHEALGLITAPRLYFRGGDGYNISDWIERRLHIPGKILGGGHSVANFCIEIAHYLGCYPIILVGFDLAYGDDGAHYAPGVESSRGREEEQLEEPIQWRREDGIFIQTQWKWLVEASWIEDFAKKQCRWQKLINATPRGMRLQGIIHMGLQEIAQNMLRQSFDVKGLLHTHLEELTIISCKEASLLKWMGQMYDSLFCALQYLDVMSCYIEKAKKKPQRQLEHPWQEATEVVCSRQSLEREPAFHYILEVFDRMRTKLDFYVRQFHAHPARSLRERGAFELELGAQHILFLKEVATVNQMLIVREVKSASRGDIQAFCPKNPILWT
jgi:hypothetical protein